MTETIKDKGWIEAHEILQAAVFESLKSRVGTSFPLSNAFGGFKWELSHQKCLEQLRFIASNRGINESAYDYDLIVRVSL